MPEDHTKKKRISPHPLSLHVATATQNWAGATVAFPLFQLGATQIHPDLKNRADDLRQELKNHVPLQVQMEIMKQARQRLSDYLQGIATYQAHPYQRNLPLAPLFHKIGTTELLDYGSSIREDAPLLLAVPSLVNPSYILDLREKMSFMRYFTEQDIHPYLLNWAVPGTEEIKFGLEDYIMQRLVPMIRHFHQHHGRKIHLLGYCMGGNLSLAAARILQSEDIISSLTLIATPWDFHADQPVHLPSLIDTFLKAGFYTDNIQSIPVNMMQMFFFSLDPTLSDRKFRRLAKLDPDSEQARNMVAVEDWANDGAALSFKLAHDCLTHWYQQNQTQRNCWQIAGQIIDPAELSLPGHIITTSSDRIVPPASAKALAKKLPHFAHSTASGGHVNMIVGKGAKTTLWHKIALSLK